MKEIITKLDISGDKKLSKEEFINGYVLIYYYLHIENFHSFYRCKNDPVILNLLAPNA